jgi:L-lactate dehydrogenase complex protein LldG
MSDILSDAANAARRQAVLGRIRRSFGVTGDEAQRNAAVEARIEARAPGVVPARGQLAKPEQVALFAQMITAADATLTRVAAPDAVPEAITAYLRDHNLPQRLRHGEDARLAHLPWEGQPQLEIDHGRAEDATEVSLSHGFAGVAETGTLVLLSGPDNPTSLNFLPENHIVVLDAADIVGDLESVWQALRARFGEGRMPRTVNLVTGPSRSGDIEQTILLGAHGPRRLHVVLVG